MVKIFNWIKGFFVKQEVIPSEPIWLEKARSYLGLSEIPGAKHNEIILQFWKNIKQSGVRNDEIAWCAAFTGSVLEECNIKSTRSQSARSYNTWGLEFKSPCPGCIAVLWRDKPESPFGHVGFVVGQDKNGNLMILGGNQANKVSIKAFPLERVLSYRWPVNILTPKKTGFNTLAILSSDGTVSQNEA